MIESSVNGFSHVSHSPLICHVKVKSDYAQLRETLASVSEQRDLARREKDELQDKLENLEQALKVRNINYFLSYNNKLVTLYLKTIYSFGIHIFHSFSLILSDTFKMLFICNILVHVFSKSNVINRMFPSSSTFPKITSPNESSAQSDIVCRKSILKFTD